MKKKLSLAIFGLAKVLRGVKRGFFCEDSREEEQVRLTLALPLGREFARPNDLVVPST